MKHWPIFAAVLFTLAGPVLAQFGGTEVQAELVSENKSIAPGKPFTVAVKLVHQAGWHTYWINPGSVQLPPKIAWDLPAGFVAGEVQWPVPHVAKLQGAVSYYFSDTTFLLTEITPPSDLAVGGTVEIKGEAKWQHCDETSCKQGQADLSLPLPVTAAAEWNEPTRAELAKFKAENLPQALQGWEVRAFNTGVGYDLIFEPTGEANANLTKVYFLSADKQVDAQKEQKLERDGTNFVLKLAKNTDFKGSVKTLPGVLYSEEGLLKNGTKALAINPEFKFRAAPVPFGKLMSIAAFAFLGGLILNLMPCVFPVIGIKIFSFVNQAGEDKRKVVLHGLVFALGVLVSFWVLSAIVFYLRSRGEQIGWGFQLQNPWFVYGLLLIMFVFGLNMFGLFEVGGRLIGVGSELTQKQGFSGSFFSGVLATVVATPCSGPFLGVALGAVISMPAIPFFTVFTCIALGLALPYLLLSAFPGLVNKLPRPGAWMESFKQGMSFLLFGTAGLFLWIYSNLVSEENGYDALNSMFAVVGLSAIAAGFWIWGRWNSPAKIAKTRIIGGALAALLVVAGIWVSVPTKALIQWEHWTPELQEELISEGKPVYIDFTAKWCVTCQTNKLSYRSKALAEAAKERKIVFLKADWTKPDPEITKALADHERSAIPVNVLYIPEQEKPLILPSVLTSGVVLNHFKQVPLPAKS